MALTTLLKLARTAVADTVVGRIPGSDGNDAARPSLLRPDVHAMKYQLYVPNLGAGGLMAATYQRSRRETAIR